MLKRRSNRVYQIDDSWQLLYKGDYYPISEQQARLYQAQQNERLTLKVNKLTDHALSWAVAVALSYDPSISVEDVEPKSLGPGTWQNPYEDFVVIAMYSRGLHFGPFRPLVDCSQGYPLLDKHRISTEVAGDGWAALYNDCFTAGTYSRAQHGATRLEAGLRCLVAQLHGPTIEVPADLVEPEVRRLFFKLR